MFVRVEQHMLNLKYHNSWYMPLPTAAPGDPGNLINVKDHIVSDTCSPVGLMETISLKTHSIFTTN